MRRGSVKNRVCKHTKRTHQSYSPGGKAPHFPARQEGLEEYSCFMCGFECRHFEVLKRHTKEVHHKKPCSKL
ncbi:hypothetical protein SRHO_G00186610 [Serrasalmus rhombeus]